MPLLGAIYLKWDVFSIVVVYWTENVVLGVINVLKMITCCPEPDEVDWAEVDAQQNTTELQMATAKLREGKPIGKLNHHTSKLYYVTFFCIHYGFFCFGHGLFVLELLGPKGLVHGNNVRALVAAMSTVFTARHLWWCVAALAASHLYSFVFNFLRGGEYRRTVAPVLMWQPYRRVVLLHLSLIFGAYLATKFGSNLGVLVLLIAGKTFFDLQMHLRERDWNAKPLPAMHLPTVPKSARR